MFDEHQPLQNGHSPESADELAGALPLDLEAIHARLMRESDGWVRRLPAAEPLASYARDLARDATVVAEMEPDSPDKGDPPEEIPSEGAAPLYLRKKRPSYPSRGRTLLGIAAAVAIVALMAAVFSNLAPGRGPATGKPTAALQPTSTPLPTATPRPAFGPVTGSWQAVPGLTNVQGSVFIAPSDPSVVYEVLDTQPANGEPVGQYALLRRSNDGGKTWRRITVPKPTDSSVTAWAPGGVIVSSADPNVLLISINTQMSYNVPTACPADLTMAYRPQIAGPSSASKTLAAMLPSDGFQRCSVQYASSDSGAHWTKVAISGIHPSVDGLLTLAAQGNQLFGTVYADDQQTLLAGYHIVTSTDGIHWQPVDAPLLSQVKHICGFVAVPTGTTLFANTNSGDCDTIASHADELWRSDDGGAHWRDLGSPGNWISVLGAAEQGPYDAQPTLYVYTLNKRTPYDFNLYLKVSTDGGYTWQASPAAGMPAHFTPVLHMAGMLSDGSLVEMFTSNPQAGPHTPVTIGFYAWHAGDSEWHQVAPSIPLASNLDLTDGGNQFFVTPSGGVHGMLWHIQYNPAFTGSTISVTRYSS
jgi:hypothetical protein